jgi:hypothetical protein
MAVGNNAGDHLQPDVGSKTDFRTQRLNQIREIVGDQSTGSSEDDEGARGLLSSIVNLEKEDKDAEYFFALARFVDDSVPSPTVDDITNAVLATEFLYEKELNPDNKRPQNLDPESWKGWGDAVERLEFNIGQTIVDQADGAGMEGLEIFYDSDLHRQMFVKLADDRILNVDERVEYDTYPRKLSIVTESEMEKALSHKVSDEEGKQRRKASVDEYTRSEFGDI